LQAAGIKVVGVSPDDTESHKKFIEKYGLNFDLLSDQDHSLAEAMKVWKQKNFMGKTYMGIERSTFLLNEGRIVKAWQPVKVEGHVDEVLNTAERYSGGSGN
jgi:peroxiredoxin Q/BCP